VTTLGLEAGASVLAHLRDWHRDCIWEVASLEDEERRVVRVMLRVQQRLRVGAAKDMTKSAGEDVESS
jgi:hypothetical protein